MPRPEILARIEEPHELAIHDRRKICSLGKVAPVARLAKVVGVVGTAMLPGDDVLDVKRYKRQLALAHPAIFTAVSSTFADDAAERGVDGHLNGGNHS